MWDAEWAEEEGGGTGQQLSCRCGQFKASIVSRRVSLITVVHLPCLMAVLLQQTAVGMAPNDQMAPRLRSAPFIVTSALSVD